MPLHFLRPNFNANTFCLKFWPKNLKEVFSKERKYKYKNYDFIDALVSKKRNEVKK